MGMGWTSSGHVFDSQGLPVNGYGARQSWPLGTISIVLRTHFPLQGGIRAKVGRNHSAGASVGLGHSKDSLYTLDDAPAAPTHRIPATQVGLVWWVRGLWRRRVGGISLITDGRLVGYFMPSIGPWAPSSLGRDEGKQAPCLAGCGMR